MSRFVESMSLWAMRCIHGANALLSSVTTRCWHWWNQCPCGQCAAVTHSGPSYRNNDPDTFTHIIRFGPPPPPGDVDGDGDVDFDDVLLILAGWRECGGADPCEEDLNGDGIVGFADLLIVLSNWTG